MKTPEQVLASVENRVRDTWAAAVVADLTGTTTRLPPEAGGSAGSDAGEWPRAFPLGAPAGAELAGNFLAWRDWAEQWRGWVVDRPGSLRTGVRIVAGTRQQLPTHLVLDTLTDAAALIGNGWPDRLEVAYHRGRVLLDRFAATASDGLGGRLREVSDLSDVDFGLLVTAAAWFTSHDAAGLTPRQVPVEGLHAKWLNHRQHLVCWLAGVSDLGLAPPHPARAHFTYLDPDHLAGGGRRHDCATVGDTLRLPYRPRVVVISENKDTAVGFGPVPGGVAVEGAGFGGKTAAAFGWVIDAPVLLYWGDVDAHGLEILDGYRRDGVPAVAMLMDEGTYEAYRRFGTDLDVRGKPLTVRTPRETPYLTAAERALYERLCGPDPGGPRRIEQERISLADAAEVVRRHVEALAAPVVGR